MKRKGTFADGGFDSDSDVEIDVDVGLTVDKNGLATASHCTHTQQLQPLRLPLHHTSPIPSLNLSTSGPAMDEAPEEKKKRKQVRNSYRSFLP